MALTSKQLVAEYRRQVPEPRNEYVTAFFELLTEGRSIDNWARWTGRLREAERECRFPREDRHVLRTAAREAEGSTVFTEEGRQLTVDSCLYRRVRIRVTLPA